LTSLQGSLSCIAASPECSFELTGCARGLSEIIDRYADAAFGREVIAQQNIVTRMRRFDRRDSQALADKFSLKADTAILNCVESWDSHRA
jgi:hypothetical protein